MTTTSPSTPLYFGFLTILREASGYLGGYLVMNSWGRPLEFRLSTAVQPNKVQQILYGSALHSYLYADLIGKSLLEKSTTPVQLLLTDSEPALDLRLKLETPVLWLAPPGDELGLRLTEQGLAVRAAQSPRGPLLCHPRHPGDVEIARPLLDGMDSAFDLTEPFARIREAIGEARKMGVTKGTSAAA